MTDKESRDHSYEGYLAKLRDLAVDSPTFDIFIEKVKTFTSWYHGQPILQEFTRWTLVDYQKFYQESKQ